MSSARILLLGAVALGIVACGGPSSSSRPTAVDVPPPASNSVSSQASARPVKPGGAFGGERLGFAEASSLNGRFVVLRLFEGNQPPMFGQHGEASVATDVFLHDTVNSTDKRINDVIDLDTSRRWLLLIQDSKVQLLDSVDGKSSELLPIDATPDSNACLAPRTASFSAKGARVAWIGPGSTTMQIRDLSSGKEWTVKSNGLLWRGMPDDDGTGATLLEVPAGSQGWPAQHTSCACRWCGRFAASYGFYGWGGPKFTIEHVDDKGGRQTSKVPESEGSWHGKTDKGCELKPASEKEGVETGPWRWVCPN